MIKVKLEKVKVDSITAKFVTVEHDAGMQDTTPQVVYESVQEEARSDILAAQESKNQSTELDIEKVVAQKRQLNATEQQIKDLETIAQIEEDGSDDDDGESMEVDSDESEMARIQSKHYGDDSDSDDVEMNSAAEESDMEEQGEEEMSESDAEMVSASDSGDSDDEMSGVKKPLVKGKKALREKIQQEKEIRAKETKMRQTEGVNPQSINDFERLLMADQDQSYLWI